MANELRTLEHEAFDAQRCGDYESAVSFWLRLLEKVNNWEHGYAHYNLANCYSRLRLYGEAEKHYAEAARIAPYDTLFSDALASLVKARTDGLL